MRDKVMEALGAGKAVLASPLAVEGLTVADGEQVAVADTDEELIARAIRLLSDAASRAALGRAARAWAVANLGWEHRVAAFEALYTSLVAG
jgi:glycosyltransferase involved in cell wall biosynthesis